MNQEFCLRRIRDGVNVDWFSVTDNLHAVFALQCVFRYKYAVQTLFIQKYSQHSEYPHEDCQHGGADQPDCHSFMIVNVDIAMWQNQESDGAEGDEQNAND